MAINNNQEVISRKTMQIIFLNPTKLDLQFFELQRISNEFSSDKSYCFRVNSTRNPYMLRKIYPLITFNECSLFPLLRLAFFFCLDFCSDLVLSLHQGVFGPLVYVGIHQKSCFKKV
jgi:hypothetical protein